MKPLIFLFLGALICIADSTLLGSNKCTWGPAYWCGSLGNAKECGAFKHCLSAVWKRQKLNVIQDATCDACKKAVQELHDMLANNKTEAELHSFLDQLCQQIPDQNAAQVCQQEVDANFDEIIQLLLSELDPPTLCSLLGLCQNAKQKFEKPLIKKLVHVPLQKIKPASSKMQVSAAPQCVICEFVMKEIDGMLSKNATEQEIIHALDTVCSILPSTVGQECRDFIDTYGPAILTLLAQEMSPSLVCTAIGLCTGSDDIKALRSWEQCDLCKMTVKYLVAQLGKSTTQNEIKAALDKVCDMLPGDTSKSCDALVAQYEPTLIYILQQELKNPDHICQTLKMCTNSGLHGGGKKQQKRQPQKLKYIPHIRVMP